jgi:hypothetical protein
MAMTSDVEQMLESDHLDQLLETPEPAQPVVVVQYRNRGVSPWLFGPFVVVVIAAALYVYHRTVVERFRVQAAEDRQFLAKKIETERALMPLVRDSTPSKAVLPEPSTAAESANSAVVSHSTPGSATAATDGIQPESKAGSDLKSPPTSVASGNAVAGLGQTRPGDSTAPAVAGAVQPADTSPAPPASVAAGENPPAAAQEKTAALTTPSAVRDPFDEDGTVPNPPIPNDAARKNVLANGPDRGPAGGSLEKPGREGGAPGAGPADADHAPPADGPRTDGTDAGAPAEKPQGRIGAQPLAPLPTKEESERAIMAEAAKREAELKSRVEDRDLELLGQRVGEQLKFREELRGVLKAKRKEAGPDIEKLNKRYDFDVEPDKKAQAWHIWRHGRLTTRDKLRKARELGLPDTTILQFMCASLDETIGTRNGPRDHYEVWVKAAEQLLRNEPPQIPTGTRSGTDAGAGALPTLTPTATPAKRKVFSTPRE